MTSTKVFDTINVALVAHFFGAVVVSYLFKLFGNLPIDTVKIMASVAPLTFTLWCGIAIGMINTRD